MSRILFATCCALTVALFAPIASSAQGTQTTASPSASPSAAPAMSNDQVGQLALNILAQLQNQHIDRSLFNDATNAQLTDYNVQQLGPQLSALGQPQAMFLSKQDMGGGVTQYTFLLRGGAGKFDEILALDAQGKVAGINFTQDHSH